MKGIKTYRILTYILLPFAAYLSLNILGSLVMSLGNVGLLLSNFIIACLPIYIFTSSYFLFNGVFKAKSCKHGLKDWIKVNAYVSILFAAIMILCALAMFMVFSNKELTAQLMAEFNSKNLPGIDQVNKDQLIRLIKIYLSVMLPFSIVLVIHIALTFKALKLYSHVFDEEA